ncbi:MAG TPA: hypothetical protein VIS74_03925 [Chthoniobacterales bacterium]
MNPAAEQNREIERRFLIPAPPANLDLHPSRLVEQGYLASGETTVRLRRDGESAFVLTVKRGVFPNTEEREALLTAAQFETLWPLTAGRRIRKTRHAIPHGPHTIELDFFHGIHEGLRIAEVEFSDTASCETFVPPDWFGQEITGRREYSNAALARE